MSALNRLVSAMLCVAIAMCTAAGQCEVTAQQVMSHRPSSIARQGDRVFYCPAPGPGDRAYLPNIFEISESCPEPRALLSQDEVRKYKPGDEFLLRPGKRAGLLFVSGQMDEDGSGMMRRCLVLVDLGSSSVRTLADNGRDIRAPSFSPDGSAIAFWSGSPRIAFTPILDAKEGYTVHVVDIQTSTEMEILKADTVPAVACPPAWSPDGKRIACISSSSSPDRKVQIVCADGTGKRIIGAQAAYSPSFVVWAGGDKLLFTQDGKPGLYGIEFPSERIALAKEGGYLPPLVLSPDRRLLKTLFYEKAHAPSAIRVLKTSNLAPVQETDAGLFMGEWNHPVAELE